jgi:hypothetical protein
MVDVGISVVLGLLTLAMAYLGVQMTLHPPEDDAKKTRYKWGFAFLSVANVALIVLQGVRNGQTQSDLQTDVREARDQAKSARTELQTVRAELEREGVRRQQAEKDLGLIVRQAGSETRSGVAEDFRKAPIQVQLNGQPTADPTKALATRNKLGQLLEQNEILKTRCLKDPVASPQFSCAGQAQRWFDEALQFVSENMEGSYRARLRSKTGLSLDYGGAKGNQETNGVLNALTFKAAALAEFITELR